MLEYYWTKIKASIRFKRFFFFKNPKHLLCASNQVLDKLDPTHVKRMNATSNLGGYNPGLWKTPARHPPPTEDAGRGSWTRALTPGHTSCTGRKLWRRTGFLRTLKPLGKRHAIRLSPAAARRSKDGHVWDNDGSAEMRFYAELQLRFRLKSDWIPAA